MRAWVIAVSVVISSWDVQSPLLFRCSCFIRSHLQECSYHPVSRSLFCTLLLIFLLSLPLSFLFWKTMASLSLALSHPSYSWPTRLYLFFLTSLSFFPVFQPQLFPPSFSVTLAYHPAHFPCPPFLPTPAILLSLRYALATPESTSLFLFLLLFLEFVIFHTSWHHPSHVDPVSTLILSDSLSEQISCICTVLQW